MLNYIAPINQLGYGQVGTNLHSALNKLGISTSLFPYYGIDSPPKHHEEYLKQALENAKEFDYKAPSFHLYHQFALEHSVGRGLKSAYTFFELNKLNKREVHQINYQDVMFSPTKWAKQVMIDCGVTTKIEVLNPGVDLEFFNNVKPAEITSDEPNTTVFINCGKWMINKGHDFLLETFNKAFTAKDNVLLIMLCFNPIMTKQFNGPEESKQWEYHYMTSPLGSAGKINVINRRFETQAEIASIMGAADCGFFPARAEGWNMPLAECLSLGKHGIVTNHSAHTEFVEKAGCHLIDIDELEEAYSPPFFKDGEWASLGNKQLDQTVELLRSIHKQKQEETLKINQQGYDLFRKELTWENAAKTVKRVLEI